MIQSIAKGVGASLSFAQVTWHDQLLKMQNGQQDVALGVTKTKDREAYAHFSKPYRYEQVSLFVHALGENSPEPFHDITQCLKFLKTSSFRLGVIQGMDYGSAALTEFLKDPKNKDRVFWAHSDQEHMENLLAKKIDGVLTDRLSASMVLWKMGQGRFVEEISAGIKIPIYLMLSKKNITPKQVKAINKAIDLLQAHGLRERITQNHLFVTPLQESLHRPWFLALELLGVVAFALSGALIALRYKQSFLPMLCVMGLPSLGAFSDGWDNPLAPCKLI